MKAAFVLAVAIAALAYAPGAFAAPPPNDDFANATTITSFPFSDTVDVSQATTEPDEPQACYYSGQTVWYVVTPTSNGMLRASTSGGLYYANLNVYESIGPGLGGLSFIGCGAFGNEVALGARAGTTYYLQAGSIFGFVGDLRVNAQLIQAPPNDDFGHAAPIDSVPFADTVDTSLAGNEAGEPTPTCGYGPASNTVWYAYTPTASGSVTATASGVYPTVAAAYTGTSLGGLTEQLCRSFSQPLTIHVDAGSTYYFMVGGIYGGSGTLHFRLEVAPDPVAALSLSPGDPSTFDTVRFYDSSYDPGGRGIESESWDFGDGASGTGCCPTHRYAGDDDYTVRLTVTTADGRTASTSQVVHVRTHDVAIVKLAVPQSASAGQTRQITVGLSNVRYPENVAVQLLAARGASGFQEVGRLTQLVPVRSGGRTTTFAFSYTFTAEDAAAGKVTFKAVATIVGGARDAIWGDNEAVALPTRVSG
jgi:hypothetical protein